MAEDNKVIERLERYAQAIARKQLQDCDLGYDDAWHEDITQTLVLAGWQVLSDTGDEGKARHRMSSRAKNEARKLGRDLRQPRPISALDLPEGSDEDERTPLIDRQCRVTVGPVSRSSPLEDATVAEYLDGLPDRRRQILQMRMAMLTVPEIAKELGISPRTVERELAQIRKDYEDEHAE